MRERGTAGPALALALSLGWAALAQPPAEKPAPEQAPAPLARAALLKGLAADPQVRKVLLEQIEALGGEPEAVLEGKAAARPGEDMTDMWHQGVTLTPRDSQLVKEGKPYGVLVVYNVFMHSLKDCLAGNYLPVASGPGPSPYAAAGLYDMPGAEDAEHPWIVEVGFELAGLKPEEIALQVNHEPVPTIRLGNTALIGFVRVGGGRHFVEITQPLANPEKKTRRFWYTRALRL